MAPERPLGEHEHTVLRDFENSTTPLQQLDGGFWKRGSNLGCQTGGPWFVVSNDAITNRDGHGLLKSIGGSVEI